MKPRLRQRLLRAVTPLFGIACPDPRAPGLARASNDKRALDPPPRKAVHPNALAAYKKAILALKEGDEIFAATQPRKSGWRDRLFQRGYALQAKERLVREKQAPLQLVRKALAKPYRAVPREPFSNRQALRYLKMEDGFFLYRLGPDGKPDAKDDGGVPIKTPDPSSPAKESPVDRFSAMINEWGDVVIDDRGGTAPPGLIP